MCGGDVQQFCALTSTAFSWYVIGWVGCVLIILGILLFFGIHASNYAHIGNANRYVELGNLRIVDHRDRDERDRDRGGRVRLPEKYEIQSTTQWSDSRANYSMRTSTSRQAEQMSDSVSQFDKRRDKRLKPVY